MGLLIPVVVLAAVAAVAGIILLIATWPTPDKEPPHANKFQRPAGLYGIGSVPPKQMNTVRSESKKTNAQPVPCSPQAAPSPSSTDDSFATSMLIGMATDNALLGGLIGGNMAGGIVGDMLNDGHVDAFGGGSSQAESYSSGYDTFSSDSSSSSGFDSSSGGSDWSGGGGDF